MAVDADTRKAYLFGGAGRRVPCDDAFYELDLVSNAWRRLKTTGSSPPSLQGATLTFDAARRVLVLAGGLKHLGLPPATLSKVWVYDPSTNQWDETDCGEPMRRRDHMGAYDPTTGQHILLGGRISTTVGHFYDRGTMAPANVRLELRRASDRARESNKDRSS